MRLIDADSLRKELYNSIELDCDSACKIVDDAPTIDAQPIGHSYWIKRNRKQFCANCDSVVCRDEDDRTFVECIYPWCPFCGARMDLEEE